ncbi:MAG: PAS domain S-box protein [Spirochaetales bacterium]|nr:PAS domain S-box protein [Spirochaetales bacterium]
MSTNIKVILIVVIALGACILSIFLGEYFHHVNLDNNLALHNVDKLTTLIHDIKNNEKLFIQNADTAGWNEMYLTMENTQNILGTLRSMMVTRKGEIGNLDDAIKKYNSIMVKLYHPAINLNRRKEELARIGISFSQEVERLIIEPFRKEEGIRLYEGKPIDPVKTRVKEEAYNLLSLYLKQQILLLELVLNLDMETYQKEKKAIENEISLNKSRIKYIAILLGQEPDIQSAIASLDLKVNILFGIEQEIVEYFNTIIDIEKNLDEVEKSMTGIQQALLADIGSDIASSNLLNGITNWSLLGGILFALSLFGLFLARDIITFMKDLKTAQKTIAQSEERFRSLIEQASDAMYLVDFDGRFLEVNNHACHNLCYEKDELLSMNIGDIDMNYKTPDRLKSEFATLTPGEPVTIVTRHIRKDRSVFPVEIKMGLIEFGGRTAVIGFARDITDRVRSAEALRLSEENLRITLDSIGDGVIATDTSGRVTRMNRVAEQLTGWSFEAARGRPLHEIFHVFDSDTQEVIDDPVVRVLRCNGIVEFANNSTLVSRNEREYLIADSGAPIKDKEGNIFGVVLIFRDVTEKHRLQERLRHSQKMDAIGQLAGGVAHDFNNMLTGIINAAEFVGLIVKDDPKVKNSVDIILDAAGRAADLTRKLLAFSRKGKMMESEFSIHECIENAVSILERSISKSIEIRLELSAENPIVFGDLTEIQNAVLNLGINARDAMPRGGTLRIKTGNLYLDEDYCRKSAFDLRAGTYCEITVEDTGVGMNTETLERIFEPFFTTKQDGLGTGLGLASVYGTVKKHRGEIHVYSHLGKGTVFRIFLPVTDAESMEALPESESIEQGQGCILVVDDEETIRKAVTTLLEEKGYTVLSAGDGFEAIAIYKEEMKRINLVLLDLIMPHKNGNDTFYELKSINPDIKVILSSGFSADTNAADLLKDGASFFIQKPYRHNELLAIINKLLH